MGLGKAIQSGTTWACNKLGKANLPVYTVATVAIFKGILRPAFTMMDKKQDPETKKYAAVREGATELIAIPTYIGLSWLTQKLAPAFSPNGKTADQLLHSTKSTLGFLGVCIAALYAIPKLCNITMPHMMKILKMDKPKKDEHKVIAINEKSQEITSMPINNGVQSSYAKTPIIMNGGMRV